MRSNVTSSAVYADLLQKIEQRTVHVAIMGLGYVGLPLAVSFCASGVRVTGIDIDEHKCKMIRDGNSYINSVSSGDLRKCIDDGFLKATSDFQHLRNADAVIICVPTPLSPQREPDISYVMESISEVAKNELTGKIVILESTTYPGTISDEVRPYLLGQDRRENEEYFLAFSPEREDPGNKSFHTGNIPKIVGADHADSLSLAVKLYEIALDKVIPVSSTKVAEAAKITENIFRAVNIALVNELKIIYDAMGIDVWEVIEAASSKPFGYMPFYPGPGLGGHCIPIDPFYLTWKAREYDHSTRFIELAGEINRAMPDYVVRRTVNALNDYCSKAINGARILIVGLSYKKNINDLRESPSFHIIKKLRSMGGRVDYYDPHAPVVTAQREHPELLNMKSISFSEDALSGYDVALIVTDHDEVDYDFLASKVPLIIDTRNVYAGRSFSVAMRAKIVKS